MCPRRAQHRRELRQRAAAQDATGLAGLQRVRLRRRDTSERHRLADDAQEGVGIEGADAARKASLGHRAVDADEAGQSRECVEQRGDVAVADQQCARGTDLGPVEEWQQLRRAVAAARRDDRRDAGVDKRVAQLRRSCRRRSGDVRRDWIRPSTGAMTTGSNPSVRNWSAPASTSSGRHGLARRHEGDAVARAQRARADERPDRSHANCRICSATSACSAEPMTSLSVGAAGARRRASSDR